MKRDVQDGGRGERRLVENMNRKKEIIQTIDRIAGKYSAYEVFSDWIKCCSLALHNQSQLIRDETWREHEQEYLDTMKKYTEQEKNQFVKMFVLLTETLETEMVDVLGQIYMESGMGSKAAGQFFTPYHLSELCAQLALPEPDENGKYRINEPSCGGGGMIIAAASAIKKRGMDYQNVMDVVAQDLDWKGVYMCHLQLSLLGIKAVCVQGDTLSDPYIPGKTDKRHILVTPRRAGLLI